MKCAHSLGGSRCLSVICAAVVANMTAQAQESAPSLCTPFPCSRVAVGPFTIPETWAFIPDRRPVGVITLSNGSYELNSEGMTTWWHAGGTPKDNGIQGGIANNGVPDAFDELLRRMNDLYNLGFRRIQLRLPAGNVSEASGFADSSQYWPMAAWRRDGFRDYVATWIKAKAAIGDPVSLSIYAGYKVTDPCSLGMKDSYLPDFSRSGDVCVFYQNIKPWMDLGITEYWFDNSSPYWPMYITLQQSPDYLTREGTPRIILGGEAVPATTGNCATGPDKLKVPHPTALAAGPWVAAYRFARSRYTYDDAFVSFDPLTTEVGLMLNNLRTPAGCGPAPQNSPQGKLWDFADARRFHESGWVLWGFLTYGTTTFGNPNDFDAYTFDYTMPNGRSIEAIQRIYDFGRITAVADFDCDGRIEVGTGGEDKAAFLEAWSANLFTSDPFPTYLMGDINGDNHVDFEDLQDFSAAAENWELWRIVDPADLGVPHWKP